ncbi:Alpha/Beta hydrolase protein [Epithele typhae]|uniref:Alpha/Beta hydrolase protein n=1 Tax=Epithele typhae TaxID=378194 RepID=UPI00200794C4|nr:Alpha/Beta hydrolase protein [Epithele typhae]KAH9925391.1 Alpha/Beta hydrolase protein [Epithele typhae]
MPSAPVDAKGTVLYYEDSGAPANSAEYVTVVLIHGTCFHGATFRPLFPHATACNLRLVYVNMRGYPGSSPVSEADFGSTKDEREQTQRDRGFELAAFLCWLIDTEKIPPINGGAGGISLLSWSGGHALSFSMFGNAGLLPEKTRDVLNEYLRSFIMYEPSSAATGTTPPPSFFGVVADRTKSPTDQAIAFGIEVSSYFEPWDLPDTLPTLAPDAPPRCRIQDLPRAGPLERRFEPTVNKMSAEELRDMTHPATFAGTLHFSHWSPLIAAVNAAHVHRALYDPRFPIGPEGALATVWARVRVHLLYCDMTNGSIAWACATIRCGHAGAEEGVRRPMEVHVFNGCNHFLHWEEPERFTEILAKIA